MENGHLARVQEHFNSEYTDYDACCNRVVPRNEELQKMLVRSLPFERKGRLRMLDLGIGTGLTTRHVLNEFQNAHVDGIDFSSEMLEHACKRLGKLNGQVSLINADFTKCGLKGEYDAIFSAATIHNLPDGAKRALFAEIFGHLREGGCFVNADFISFRSSHLAKRAKEFYEDYLARNLAGKELEHWLRHAREEDLPATLEDQFAWLREAGFPRIECVWVYENVAVVCAIK